MNSCWAVGVKRYCRKASAATRVSGFLRSIFLSTIATGNSICTQHERDGTEVTLERNPKTDGLQRAMQKATMRCRGRWIIKNLQVYRNTSALWLFFR